jgi:cell division septal protein FtsQ
VKVKAPAEKGFRRARGKPGRRRGLRARLTWRTVRSVLTLTLVGYAGYRAFDLVLNASTLHVGRIHVQGNVRLSNGEVQALVRELQGANILTANLSHHRRVLLRSPWVADVALRRVLPSTIEVYVSERRPFGLCRLGSQLFLIDRHGTVLDEFGPQYAEFDLPIIDGLVRGPRKGASAIDITRAAFAARVVDALSDRPSLAKRVSQIDVTDLHDAVVLLDNDPSLLHLGEDRFRERLESYLDIAAALKERYPDIDYVDLRFEQRVYLKPRGSAARTAVGPTPARKTF